MSNTASRMNLPEQFLDYLPKLLVLKLGVNPARYQRESALHPC